MRILILFILFVIPFKAASQTEPLWNYENRKMNKEGNDSLVVYKIRNKNYFFYRNYIVHKSDTIFKINAEDLVCYSLYKKRYLFVSYYPREQIGWSIGFSLRNLTVLDIIDLKSHNQKWQYDFKALGANYGVGVSLAKISEFDPETGKIFFDIKLSIDDKSEIDIIKNDSKFPSF